MEGLGGIVYNNLTIFMGSFLFIHFFYFCQTSSFERRCRKQIQNPRRCRMASIEWQSAYKISSVRLRTHDTQRLSLCFDIVLSFLISCASTASCGQSPTIMPPTSTRSRIEDSSLVSSPPRASNIFSADNTCRISADANRRAFVVTRSVDSCAMLAFEPSSVGSMGDAGGVTGFKVIGTILDRISVWNVLIDSWITLREQRRTTSSTACWVGRQQHLASKRNATASDSKTGCPAHTKWKPERAHTPWCKARVFEACSLTRCKLAFRLLSAAPSSFDPSLRVSPDRRPVSFTTISRDICPSSNPTGEK